MMLYRIATVFTILFMAVFGSASAIDIVARTDPPQLPSCPAGTGPISCCESVQSNVGHFFALGLSRGISHIPQTSGLGPILIGIITLLLGPIVPQIGRKSNGFLHLGCDLLSCPYISHLFPHSLYCPSKRLVSNNLSQSLRRVASLTFKSMRLALARRCAARATPL
jgi:hypothetical protein